MKIKCKGGFEKGLFLRQSCQKNTNWQKCVDSSKRLYTSNTVAHMMHRAGLALCGLDVKQSFKILNRKYLEQ